MSAASWSDHSNGPSSGAHPHGASPAAPGGGASKRKRPEGGAGGAGGSAGARQAPAPKSRKIGPHPSSLVSLPSSSTPSLPGPSPTSFSSATAAATGAAAAVAAVYPPVTSDSVVQKLKTICDATANVWIAKLKQICDAAESDRKRRILGGKVGWVEVVPSTPGAAAGGFRIRKISNKAAYFFGEASRFGGVATALEASECESIGSRLSSMKHALNPHVSGYGKNSGKYLGKDLDWWRDNTQDVLDPSVLAFVPGTAAHVWIAKLKQICDAAESDRKRRILGGKVGWVEVVPSTPGAAAGGFRIRKLCKKAAYFFGEASRFGVVAAALEASECESIGRRLSRMKRVLNPHGSGYGKTTGTYLGKDLDWWRDNTQDVLDPSVLTFVVATWI
jgi:hypothetical protein